MTSAGNFSFSQLFIWGASRSQFFVVVVKGISMIGSLIVLAILSVHEFGLYQLILSVVSIASSFVAGFFDDIITNDIARAIAERNIPRAKRLFLEFLGLKGTIGLLASLALLVGAGIIARYYGQDIAFFIRLTSILVIIDACRVAQSLFFQAKVSFAVFGAEALQESVRLLAIGGFWLAGGASLREVLLSNVIAAVVVLAYTTSRFVPEYHSLFQGISAASTWMLPGIVRQYGKLVSIRYAISKMYKGVDVWLIRIFINTEAVALYALATNLVTFAQNLIPTNLLAALLPREVSNRARFQYLYRRMTKYGFWFGVVIAVSALIGATLFIDLAFPKYIPAKPLFWVMVFSLPLYAVYKFQKSFLTVLREQKILTSRLVTEAAVASVLLVVFLPIIGLLAAAINYLLIYGWRVIFFAVSLRGRHPELSIRPKDLFSVDRDDRTYISRAFHEVLKPSRWLRAVRVRFEP